MLVNTCLVQGDKPPIFYLRTSKMENAFVDYCLLISVFSVQSKNLIITLLLCNNISFLPFNKHPPGTYSAYAKCLVSRLLVLCLYFPCFELFQQMCF